MASESENKRSVAPMWIILFIVVGALILGFTARLEDHNVFKPILESLGDGLFLLGLIDLYVQSRLIASLEKPSELQELLTGVKRATDIFGETNQWVIDQNRSIQTHDNVDKILTEIQELREQLSKPRP
jgi:hypothetical protein